jgi:hypothetical protein
MSWVRRCIARLLQVRRLPAVLAAAFVVLAVVPGGLAAAAAGAGAGGVTHLPPELARLHAKALAGKAAQQPGVTVRNGRQPSLAITQGPARLARPGVMSPALTYESGFTAIGGDERMRVWWNPTSTMPATSTFNVQLSAVASYTTVISTCVAPRSATTCSFTGLANGHQYFATMYVCDSAHNCSNQDLAEATVARWPDQVTNVSVSGGNNSITATWPTPANNGGLAIDHYAVALLNQRFNGDTCYGLVTAWALVSGNRVTFSPDTASAYGGAPVNGTGYQVTVFPVNGTLDGYDNGNSDCTPIAGYGKPVTSSPAYANLQAASQQGEPGQFTPVDPVALMGSGGTAVTAGTPVTKPVLGQGEVPATGVSAVTLSVSVTGAAAGGSVYVWDSDASQPGDPVLVTSAAGAAGTVTVPIGASGTVTASSTVSGTVHLDVLGFYQDGSIGDPGSQYVGVPPQVLYNGSGGSSWVQPVTVGGIRPGAGAVVVSVTASGASASGSLTLASSASTVPDVPVLYYAPGQATSAVTMVPLAGSNPLQLRLSAGTLSTVLVTVLGYYTGPDDPAGGDFSPSPQGTVVSGTVAAGGTLSAGWPAGAPAASSVLTEWLLVSYSAVSAAGTLSVYPAGTPGAGVSLSINPGVSGQAVIPVPRTAAGGSVLIASSGASAAVTADVVGYTLQGTSPGAPTDVQATPLASGAFISWNPPCSVGSAPVSGYTITATSPAPWTDTRTMTVDGSATTAFMFGLTDTYTYTFTVTATNSAGTGPAATSFAPVTPEPTVPDPPDQPGAQAGDGSALVSWMKPAKNGDSPVATYTITAEPGDIRQTVYAYTSASVPSQSAVMTGLANGTAYTFTVTATNQVGDSDPSVESISVTQQAGQPIAPAIARARTVAAVTAGAGAAKPGACTPIAPQGHAAQPGGATVTTYLLGTHQVKVIKPPASFDPGTAPLATLHKYGFASHVKDKAALARWQRKIGHSHPVSGTPCVVAGSTRPRSAFATCYSSAAPLGQNGGTSTGDSWAGLVTDAASYPAPSRNNHFMSTGNPFGEVQGSWTVGSFTAQPGGTNEESSWVGIGGADGTNGLIHAGSAQVDNGSPFPWFELLNNIGDTGMVNPGGLSIHPVDLLSVDVTVNAAYKVFPQTVPLPKFDDSYALFSFADSGGQNETIEFDQVFQFYDGGTAECIDEDVTRGSVCWHWNLIPYACSTLYKLQKFTSIHWDFAMAWGSYGNGGAPTNAAIWPPPPLTGTCATSPTDPCWNNNKWRKSEMHYPNSNSCEVSVGPIRQINTDNENWFDTWHAKTSPDTPCPATSP